MVPMASWQGRGVPFCLQHGNIESSIEVLGSLLFLRHLKLFGQHTYLNQIEQVHARDLRYWCEP